MKQKLVPVLIHVLCCCIFLSLPILTLPPGYDKLSDALVSLPYQRDVLGYALVILFFYLNYFYLIPRLYFRKRYSAFALFVVVAYLLCTAAPNLLNLFYPESADNIGPPRAFTRHAYIGHLTHNFLRFALAFFISLLVKMNEQYRKIKKEKTEAELAYLKIQVNPHFLFNTLNTIYAMALEQSPAAADAIAKLSGIMRYVLKESAADLIPLSAELECISNYIDLQHDRFGNSVNIQYKVIGQADGKQIAPLFLLPFIENAFKHGINPETDSRITISIDVSGDTLKMHAENNIVPIDNEEPKSGLGIANTQNRLKRQYPGKHTLAISQQNDIFIVDLTIHLS